MSLMTLQQSLETLANENRGELTPATVVEYARPKASPIHDRFTWNDKVAGEKFRLVEAAMLIRSVRVSFEQNDGTKSVPMRAWVNVREQYGEPGAYVPIQRALTSTETTDMILTQAKREADAFRQKYAGLEAARKVVEAIGSFVEAN
jgi:hypothetical protein